MHEDRMLEGGRPEQEDLPRYRVVKSLPDMFLKIIPLTLLAAFMLVLGGYAYSTLHRVITCAPVASATGSDSGTTYDEYGWPSDTDSALKGCVPAELHASWILALLGAFAIVALVVLAIVLASYLLRLTYDYVDQLQQDQTRGFHTVPDQVKHAVTGLLLASAFFMIATVVVYAGIYMFAIS